MKENKQMKYFLRKSIFGLASVSAAFIVGGSFVSADEASTNKYIESIADNIDKVDSNDLMKKLSGLKTTSEVDNALKALSESDSANRDAYTAVLANSDVLATRTASQGVEIMDADREAYREINRLGETLHDPTRLEAAIKELTEAKTLDAIAAAVNHAHILASEEYNSGISMTDESRDAEWLKAAEDAEKSKISEDEDQTTEDAEEDDVETVSEESDAEADVNAEEDMEDEEEDAEKSKISEDEDQTTEDAEEDDVETVSEESDAEADVNAEEDMEDEEDEDEESKISEDEDQTTEDAEEDDVETVSEESDAEADVNAEEDMEDEEDEDEADEDEVDEDEVEDEDEVDEDAVEDEDENEGNKEDPKINITPSPKEKETKESRQAMRDKLMAETKEREAKAAKDENEGNKEDPKINITPSPKEKETKESRQAMRDKLMAETKEREAKAAKERLEKERSTALTELDHLGAGKETKESRQAMRDKLMAETKEREAKAAKERLEKERSTALTELDHLGAGRLLKNIVSTAKTVEGIKEFMAITRPSLEHAMKVKATSGLTDFLKSQRSAEDTVKDIILTNAKNAALKKLEKLGATDHLKELVENAKTVEDIRTLMAEATPSLEATLSKEEADQVAPEVSEEAPMGSENPMPEGVETDTESSEILNTDKDVERQATGKSVLADIEGKASAPFVQTDAKKPAMEATKEKTPVKAEETKKADQHLPVTGEKVNPFFTGVALSIIASAGMVAYSTKRKEN